MDQSPRLSLSYVMPSQAQKHVTVNETFRRLDALVQLTARSRMTAAEPASPSDGDVYILPASPTGASWSNFTQNNIAAFQDGAWIEIAAGEGFRAYAADENILVAYDGSAWSSISGGGGSGAVDSIFSRTGAVIAAVGDYTAGQVGFTPAGAIAATDVQAAIVALDSEKIGSVNPIASVGVNATADTMNRLSVNSGAILFNRETDNIQIKVNKQAASASGTFLFQTNFSGRAEFGLAGDDDFHFKVSPDGATFFESFVLDKDTGDAAFKQNLAADGFFDIREIAAPANPAANIARLYVKDETGTTKLAMRDSAGVETVFGAGGGGGVLSVFTRTGAVTAAASDYDANQVDFTPAGAIAATDVQAAIAELDAEKQPIAARLTDIADNLSAASGLIEKTSATAFGTVTITAAGKALIGEADATAQRATLGLVIGTDVQAQQAEALGIAISDETTALTSGTAKATFRMPYAFTLTAVRASLTTAQASGSLFTVDINDGGASILSTKLTIDNAEKTSTTAAAAAVISDTALADDAEITIDIDEIGDGSAKGLKVWLIGNQA